MAKAEKPEDKRHKIPPGQLKQGRNMKTYALKDLSEGLADMDGRTYRVLYDPDGYMVIKAASDVLAANIRG